jgi:hypothetical protein
MLDLNTSDPSFNHNMGHLYLIFPSVSENHTTTSTFRLVLGVNHICSDGIGIRIIMNTALKSLSSRLNNPSDPTVRYDWSQTPQNLCLPWVQFLRLEPLDAKEHTYSTYRQFKFFAVDRVSQEFEPKDSCIKIVLMQVVASSIAGDCKLKIGPMNPVDRVTSRYACQKKGVPVSWSQ